MIEQSINILFLLAFTGMFCVEFWDKDKTGKDKMWLFITFCIMLVYIIKIVTH